MQSCAVGAIAICEFSTFFFEFVAALFAVSPWRFLGERKLRLKSTEVLIDTFYVSGAVRRLAYIRSCSALQAREEL